jgi:hypothetical protein
LRWPDEQRIVLWTCSDGQSAAIAILPGACRMRIESSGHSQGNPRLYELIEHAPKSGKSPTVWAWPELIDYLKIAGQPVAGPWPPHQEPRPDPDYESGPVAIPDPHAGPAAQTGSAARGQAQDGE